MADGERESVLRFLEECRKTHVEWVEFLEIGAEHVLSAEHVGDVAHHRECILGYDRALELLGETTMMVQKDDVDYLVRTVELTGKEWKVLILAGDVLLYGGVGLAAVTVLLGDRWGEWAMVAIVVAVLAIPVGALLTTVGRIGRWWCHS